MRIPQVNVLVAKRVLAPEANSIEEFRFTRQQVEYAKLRAAGLSYTDIGKRMGKHREDVSKSLGKFAKIYPRIYRIVQELERSKFLYKQRNFREISRAFQQHSLEKVKQGYHVGRAPFGFKKENGLLIPVPAEAEVVTRVFLDRDSGRSFEKISQQTGLSETSLVHILRDPAYKKQQPLVRWGSFRGPAKHKGFIDDELWERVQTSHQPSSAGMPPFGFKWVSGELKPDPEKVGAIQRMFRLWLDGVHREEIARQLRIDRNVVRNTIKRPLCWKSGIIPRESWESAQKIRHSAVGTVRKLKAERRIANRKLILERLAQGNATASQIAQSLNMPLPTVRFWLYDMKGLVEPLGSPEDGRIRVWSLAQELKRKE